MSKIPSEPMMRLDAAVERALIEPVDPATRIELEKLQSVMREQEVTPEGIDPPSLVGEIFTYVMPRLSNPGVLRLERRRLLLERLEARAGARDPGVPLVPGAGTALRHELQNLTLLQRSRDSLIRS